MDQEFDLWGDPIPPRVEKRGRPPHDVTPDKRLRVAVLRSLNQTNTEIAEAMGISERTLRTYYLPELKQGLAQKRAEMMVELFKAGKKGNVSAMKGFIRETEKSDLARGPALVALRPRAEPKRGKKEQAIIDASQPDPGSTMGDLMAQRLADLGQVH